MGNALVLHQDGHRFPLQRGQLDLKRFGFLMIVAVQGVLRRLSEPADLGHALPIIVPY